MWRETAKGLRSKATRLFLKAKKACLRLTRAIRILSPVSVVQFVPCTLSPHAESRLLLRTTRLLQIGFLLHSVRVPSSEAGTEVAQTPFQSVGLPSRKRTRQPAGPASAAMRKACRYACRSGQPRFVGRLSPQARTSKARPLFPDIAVRSRPTPDLLYVTPLTVPAQHP